MNPILKWLLMWFVGLMNGLLVIFYFLMQLIVAFELAMSIDAGRDSEILLYSVISVLSIIGSYIMTKWLKENDEFRSRIKF